MAPFAILYRLRTGLTFRLEQEADRLFLWTPVLIGLGICVYFALPAEPPVWLGPGVGATGLALFVAALRVGRGRHGVIVLCAAAGFAAAQLRTMAVDGPRLNQTTAPTEVSGRVVETERVEKGVRVVLDRLSIGGITPEATPTRVRVKLLRREAPPWAGDLVTVRAILTPLPEPTMPGAFDFQRHAFFQRLGALGFAIGPVAVSAVADEDLAWSVWVERVRQRLDERLRAAFAGDPRAEMRGSLAGALITGKRADVPEDVVDAMRDAGLAHLLAISGINFVLAAGLIYWMLRAGLALIPPLALRLPVKKIAASAAFVAASFYLLLSGATVPTQRSFLMLSFALLAVLVDRLEISMRPVAMAAVGILLFLPEALVGASFQLSFAAVVGLVAAYEAVRSYRREHPRLRGDDPLWRKPLLYLAGIAFTTIVATLATAPFSIYHFNQLTVYALAANLLAIPVTSLWVMPAGVIGILAMPFGLERWPLTFMGYGSDLIVAIAKMVASWPGAVVPVPAMPQWGFALATAGALWLALWRRPWRLWGVVAVVAGMASLVAVDRPDVLITGDGRLVAVRGQQGDLWLSTMRAGRFVREAWERRIAVRSAGPWPKLGATPDGVLSCDHLGCIYAAGDIDWHCRTMRAPSTRIAGRRPAW